MTTLRKPFKKTALAIAAMLVVGVAPMEQAVGASCTWNPLAGNWNNPAAWSCGVVPGSADSATIGAARTVTINDPRAINTLVNAGSVNIDASVFTLQGGGSTTNTGTINVGSAVTAALQVQGGHNIDNTGGVINIANGSVVNQFGSAITGGTINSSGTGALVAFGSGSNFLNGVTLNGRLDLASNGGIERVSGGMVLNGTVEIGANAIFATQGNQTISGSGSIVFTDANGSNRFNLEAGDLVIGAGITVRGNTGTFGGQSFLGGAATLTNNGTIKADVAGGTITLAANGGITNNGVLAAQNGGTLLLNSNIQGNVGSQILANAGSSVVQNGITISGAVTAVGTGNFRASSSGSNFFDAVTLSGGLDLASAQGIERVTNGLTLNNATINIGANSILAPQGNQTIGGTGSIVFADNNGSNRFNLEAGVLTIGPNVTVRGNTGTIGGQSFVGGAASLINNGTISADVAAGTITLAVNSGITNNGTLSALNGGTLLLNNNVANTAGAQILVGAGSTVLQNGVTLTGALNVAGAGIFRASASGSNFFDAVAFSGALDLAGVQGIERVTNGLTLNNATINIGANSVLAPQGNQTIGGTGSIVFADANGSNRFNVEAGDLVLGAGVTVRGNTGTIGGQGFVGGAATLTNQGLISADVSGGNISVGVSGALINQGVMQAQNGGQLTLNAGGGYDNSAGTLLAGAGSVVLFNGATVTGGNLNGSGSGVFKASASAANFLNGVVLNGVLDMASGQGIVRTSAGGMVINGTINIGANSILAPQGDNTFSGTGSIVFADNNGSNRFLVEAGNLILGPGLTVHGNTGTIGGQGFVGGAATLTSNGSINADGGGIISIGIAGALTNNGLMRAQNGTLAINNALTGTGSLQVDSTGVMNLSNAANSQGKLIMGAAGSVLNIGTQNLTINNDYTNLGAGTGNSFDRRAGVNGAGLILAGGNAAQAITGSGVTNGNTANATLTLGNVRVGSTTFNYQVANTGNAGPSLRGAIQTSVNGASLNDARLSGAGATASNYNTGAPGGNSGDLGVTFTAANAGALAPLSGQVLNLRSNFGNIADQKLNIVLAGGAAAYNAAVGNAASPVQVANQRTGGSNTAAVLVTNSAPAGSFSEDLNASVASVSGAATGSGSITGRLAGTNNTGLGAISVGVNTASAGAKTGGVTLAYQTAGAVNGVGNGLGTASVGSQPVTVNGNVYLMAAGAIQTAALNFGTVQVNQLVTQNLVIRNTAVGAAGFVEDLNASFGASSGVGAGLISGSGSLNGILALTNSTAANGAMTVSVNTSAAGVVGGAIAVNYSTAGAVNGVSNGLDTAGVGSDSYGVIGTIQAVGNVISQASPLVNNPAINFGSMRVGAAAPTANVSVTNVATVAPQAALNASISSGGAPVTASGSFNLLVPGATSTNQLTVGLSTTVAGNFTGANAGSATIAFVSDAANVGNCAPNCQLDLASQQVSVSGKVYTPAIALVNTPSVDFGIVHKGDVLAAKNVSVSNNAAAGGLNDTLRGTISGGPAPFSAAGTLAGVAAQGTDASSFSIGLSTAAAGVFNGTATAAFASHDADLADLDLGTSTIALKGQVNNFAVTTLTHTGAGAFSAAGHTYTLDFGNIVLGSGDLTSGLAVLNDVIGLADLLSGDFDIAGVGAGFTLNGFGSFANLIAGDAFGGLSVVFASNVQGAFLSSLVLHSKGSNASGFIGQLDDTTLVLRGSVNAVGAVPEPGTYVLMFAGLLVVVGTARRRLRAQAAA